MVLLHTDLADFQFISVTKDGFVPISQKLLHNRLNINVYSLMDKRLMLGWFHVEADVCKLRLGSYTPIKLNPATYIS